MPDISSVFEKIHPGFRDDVNDTTRDEEWIEQLASDYCHLFLLPQNPSLSLRVTSWQSQASLDMAKLETLIKDLDFDLSTITDAVLNIPNDHLGLLLYLLSAVYSSDDPNIQKLGSPLAKMALPPWISRFVEKLSTATTNSIYLASGKLLLALLAPEPGIRS